MKYIKLITLSLGLMILSAFSFMGLANAQSFRTGNSINIKTGETINSMLFAGGNSIDIAGNVKGDVYCGGQTITITGTIDGDVICAGQFITISGNVSGSVRLAGQNVVINGLIGNSATVASQNLTIGKDSVINRDLLGGSQSTTINGKVIRDSVIGSESLTINGEVGRDISGGIESLTIGSAGQVGGSVTYTGANDPNIKTGGKIVGAVKRTEPTKEQKASHETSISSIAGTFIYNFLSIALAGFVLIGLFPRILDEAYSIVTQKTGRTALVGLLVGVSMPAIIIAMCMTIIGFPLAIITLLIWIAILMISSPLVSYIVGKFILKNTKHNKPVWAVLLGVGILALAYSIPILNFFTVIAVLIFGVGTILIQGKRQLNYSK